MIHWAGGVDLVLDEDLQSGAALLRVPCLIGLDRRDHVGEVDVAGFQRVRGQRDELDIGRGELGKLRRVDTTFCFPLPKFSDIRYNYSLAGGALMDAGCYAVHMVRTFGGSTPEVVSAQAKLRDPQIDRAMTAEVRFAAGHTGRVRCSMWSSQLVQISARVTGEHGELRVLNPVMPSYFHRLAIRSSDGRRVERFSHRASYAYQLDAFAAGVLRGEPVKTTPEDAVENMTVIDAIYRAAGLPLRYPS